MSRRICSAFVALAVLMPAAAQAEVSDAFLDGLVPDFGNSAAVIEACEGETESLRDSLIDGLLELDASNNQISAFMKKFDAQRSRQAATMRKDLSAAGGLALICDPDSQELHRLSFNTMVDQLPLRAQLAGQQAGGDSPSAAQGMAGGDLTAPPVGDEFMPAGPRFTESWFEELADNLGGGLAMMQACRQDTGMVLGNMRADLASQGVDGGQIDRFMSRMRKVASQDLKEFQASADFAQAKSEICAVPAAFGPSTMVMMAFRSAVDTPTQ